MSSSNIIKLPKRFDYSANEEFIADITAALESKTHESRVIMLDCSQMDYIDSAGIGLLVLSHKKAEAENSKICVINLKASAREILFLANLQKLIDIK